MTPRNLVVTFATTALFLATPVMAQRTTGGGTGSGGSAGGPATSPGTTGTGATGSGRTGGLGTPTGIPGNTGTTNNGNTPTTMPTPIFLNGRVVIDDGSPLPGPVTIERVCNGATHSEGYTDMKGNFGIQLGNESGVFQDATNAASLSSMPGGPGMGGQGGMTGMGGGQSSSGFGNTQERMLMNCELRAKLPGFRSQAVILAGRRPMDNPDIGTILMHRDAPGEGTIVSATSLNAPKPARKAFEKGLELLKKNKPADAREQFEKAVQIHQVYAAAWCELGKLQSASGDADMARGSFRMAVKSDGKFVVPYLELSILSLHQKNWQEVADLTDQALKLDRFDYPQAFLFNAAAKYNLQEMDAAEKSIIEAERLDTRHQYPQVAHLYAMILQQKKDYPGAAEHLTAYLKMAPNAEDADVARKQLESLNRLTTAEK